MAEQIELFPIPSPCLGVCQSDAKGYCRGCFRNREERFQWLALSDAQKRHVLRLCYQRKQRLLRTTNTTPDSDEQQPELF